MSDQFAYIETRVRMLFSLFNRKENDDLIQIFQTRLSGFPSGTLRKVFDKCECDLERFPTVRQVLAFCAIEAPGESWRFNYEPAYDRDGVHCLIDPDPDCQNCKDKKLGLVPRSKHPTKNCTEFRGDRLMYRPQDCAEGREFLETFARLADKKGIKSLDEEASRANLQAQAVAITKDPTYAREPGDD